MNHSPTYLKTVHIFLLFIALFLQTATTLRAQVPDTPLFTEVNPNTLTLNPTQQSIVNYFSSLPYNAGLKYVHVGNLSTIQHNGAITFTIPGVGNTPLTFQNVDVKYNTPSDYTWLGEIGLNQGCLAFFAKPEGYGGMIDLGTKFYSINPLGGNLALIMEHNLAAYPAAKCGNIGSLATPVEDFCAKSDCGGSLVDILVLLTPGAQANLAGTFGNLATFYLEIGTEITNLAFTRSGIPGKRVRMQYMPFTPSFTLTTNIFTDRSSLINDPTAVGFFNTYRPDIIVMLTNQTYIDGTDTIFGITSSLDALSTNKFCIVEAGFILGPRYTFAHEVAHQFGCHHIETSDLEGDVCAHAHVLSFPGVLPRGTILGTLNPGVSGARILNYSNPAITFAGVATGITDARDNAREIRASMCDVANNEPPLPL